MNTDDAEAINKFNNKRSKKTIEDLSDLDVTDSDGSTIRKDVYRYYEFIQLKRARFNCTNVEYDSDTGRIIKMEFKFNGKFE